MATGVDKGSVKSESVICLVGRDGTIDPSFTLIHSTPTSGRLKYFQDLAHRRVKITVEILEK